MVKTLTKVYQNGIYCRETYKKKTQRTDTISSEGFVSPEKNFAVNSIL